MYPGVNSSSGSITSNVISTGISEINNKLGGGIPPGSMTLIEGESDSGKSVLSQQMIWGSLHNGFRVILYTTENTIKSFIRQTASLSLDITDFLLLGRFKIFPIAVSKMQTDPSQIFTVLLSHLNTHSETNLVVVDSLTTLITHTSIEETMTYFENCKDICDEGISVINVVNSYAFSDESLARVSSISDAHLHLRTEQVGDMIMKVLEVAKVRGAEMSTGNIVRFDVEPMLGMKILPVNKVSV